uniref:Uncharacterized protein n=1 Tax=Timema poppense TaxID=170557 RepID=A0A7R9DT22_TIMPO|nr:unnamed protein product [Timema poppensis]
METLNNKNSTVPPASQNSGSTEDRTQIYQLRTTQVCTDGLDVPDDEGGSIRPVGNTKKSSQSDLYMRLGLLLGDNARRASRSAALSPPPRRPGSSTNHSHGSCASFSSLASLEATTLTSTNTSPVSTLTVGSSEADVHSHARTLKDPSSDSITSLMSVSGQSNCSSSPVSRRHSVTTSQPGRVEELNIFKNRRTSIRRSARTGSVKGPIDPKGCVEPFTLLPDEFQLNLTWVSGLDDKRHCPVSAVCLVPHVTTYGKQLELEL